MKSKSLGKGSNPVIFRILETDAGKAQQAEAWLYESMKANEIEGRVYLVFELLEFSRMGLTCLPALELNGVVLSQGSPLNQETLEHICRRLAFAQKEIEGRKIRDKN